MKRTFVDAGVLIAAATLRGEGGEQALRIIDDPEREFASSVFVKLEVLPKCAFHQRSDEYRFYQSYFARVKHWATDLDSMADTALGEGLRAGLRGMDALHVAAANQLNVDEFVTTEKRRKLLHRSTLVRRIVPIGG
jgi:predicted nucleic acid-binding protein